MQYFCVTTRDNIELSAVLSRQLRKLLNATSVHFIVPKEDAAAFQADLGSIPFARVHDENDFSPHISLGRVKSWKLPNFPQRAGWYYQQLLKLSIAENAISEDRYVIWDADTVPYKRFPLFVDDKMSFTSSSG